MTVRSLVVQEFPRGTRLRKPIAIRLERDPSGTVFAGAPDLGLWVDGVGTTDQEAIEDLETIIGLYRQSFIDLAQQNTSEYLAAMRAAFEEIVI